MFTWAKLPFVRIVIFFITGIWLGLQFQGYHFIAFGVAVAVFVSTLLIRSKWPMLFMRIIILAIFMSCFAAGAHTEAIAVAKSKILVVMSYEESNPWCVEIKEGIESVLGGHSELSYFYMDTKKDLESGPRKAAEAFAFYQIFKPDGVIAVEHNYGDEGMTVTEISNRLHFFIKIFLNHNCRKAQNGT